MGNQHPLDDCDEWDCYDQHIAERNKLIDGKRGAEDNFVKTVIQLSSGIALLVPGFLLAESGGTGNPSLLLSVGLFFIFGALIAGLSEQFLSSLAYGRQIQKTDDYYLKRSSDVSAPALSKIVGISIFIAFATFLSGVTLISLALLLGPWK